MAITVYDLAKHLLDRDPISGDDFEQVGLPMMGGCQTCGASIAAYNASPSRTGYLQCASGCIEGLGFDTVQEAAAFIWPDGHPRG